MVNKMLDLRLHCRCSGTFTRAEEAADSLGTWCGQLAQLESGLCVRCQSDCRNNRILTVEETVSRDTPWLSREVGRG